MDTAKARRSQLNPVPALLSPWMPSLDSSAQLPITQLPARHSQVWNPGRQNGEHNHPARSSSSSKKQMEKPNLSPCPFSTGSSGTQTAWQCQHRVGTSFPISCPALCQHSLLLPCLSLEAWPSTRGSQQRSSPVPLSAGICSLIGCLWKAPQLRAASTFLISKRLMLSNCLISPQHLLPFISGSLLQFIDGAVFSLSLFHRGCIRKCFHCRQRYLLLIDAYYSF